MGTFFVELLCRWVPNRHVVIIYRLKFFKLKRFTIEMKIYALYPSLWQVGKKYNETFSIYMEFKNTWFHQFFLYGRKNEKGLFLLWNSMKIEQAGIKIWGLLQQVNISDRVHFQTWSFVGKLKEFQSVVVINRSWLGNMDLLLVPFLPR